MTPTDAWQTITAQTPIPARHADAQSLVDTAIQVAQTALDLHDNRRRTDRHTELYDRHSQAVRQLARLVQLTDQIARAQQQDVA